jgi:hypothetical protein
MWKGGDSEFSSPFPPPFQFFSQIFSQLHCYPLSHASRLPWVDKAGKKVLTLPLPTHALHGGGSNGGFLSHFYPPPNHRLFSQLLFSH